jgi:hypothetical protein
VGRVVKSASGAWFRGPIVELAPCTAIERSASDDEAGRTVARMIANSTQPTDTSMTRSADPAPP